MKETKMFDVFNNTFFDSNVTTFEDEDGKFDIRLYNGHFLCTIGISTDLSVNKVNKKLLDELNKDQLAFKYHLKGNKLQCVACIWIDHKPSKKALSDMIAVLTCNLKCVKEIIESNGGIS